MHKSNVFSIVSKIIGILGFIAGIALLIIFSDEAICLVFMASSWLLALFGFLFFHFCASVLKYLEIIIEKISALPTTLPNTNPQTK